MKWNQLSIKTTTQAEDILISELADIGLEGAQIVDNQPLTQEELDQMFVDILPEGSPDDGTATLNFYIGEDVDLEGVLEQVRQVLEQVRAYMDIGEGTVAVSKTEDVDWINNWKAYFHQFLVDDILVVPSWETVSQKDQDKMILHIDPGTAFGTGMHETTQLVIRALKKHLKEGDRLLDIGTGSGILGILALKLGARKVIGTDLDLCTVSAVAENKAANEIPDDQFTLMIGNLIDDTALQERVGREAYDVITANILADVLVPLTPVASSCLKKGGCYITSGILEGKEPLVIQAMEAAHLSVTEITRQGEWVCVCAVRPA